MKSLSTPMSYHRLYRSPLDDSEVFDNLRELMDYCDTGARYDGQRVIVLNGELEPTEYVIKNNIPLIDMKGSEPIFKSQWFKGDYKESYGLLIYEDNNRDGNTWSPYDVFSLTSGKLCLLNQLEIFRLGGEFKFSYDMIPMRDSDIGSTGVWNQSYNPYIDGSSHVPVSGNGLEISYNPTIDNLIRCNDPLLNLMPRGSSGALRNKNYITKIYIKADNYYRALR